MLWFAILYIDSLYAAPPFKLPAYQPALGIDFSYYTSNSNYDSEGGSYEEIGEGRSYTNILATVYGYYGFSKRMRVMGSLGMANAQSTHTDADRSRFGLTEAMWGGQIQLVRQPFSFINETFIAFPLNRIKKDTDEVLTGEGALVMQTGAWLSKEILSHIFYFYLAYKFQDGGRASLLPWSVGFSNDRLAWAYSLEVGGFSVVRNDKFSKNPDRRRDLIRRVNGGSFKYYSVNPEVLELTGRVGYYFSQNLFLGLGFSQTLNGQNYGRGSTIMAKWEWRPGSTRKFRKIRRKKIPEPDLEELEEEEGGYGGESEVLDEIRRLERFDLPSDEYDESLFEKSLPPKKRR